MTKTRVIERAAGESLTRIKSLVQGWFPAGKPEGREWAVGDITGAPGKSLKINLDTGRWQDFATGDAGGDLVSLLAYRDGLSQLEAAKSLLAEMGMEEETSPAKPKPRPAAAPRPAKAPERSEWQPIMPVPDKIAPPGRELEGFERFWEYRDAEGRLLFYVRRGMRDGKKVILPLCYGKLGGKAGWHTRHPDAPMPLFGLQALAERPEDPVILVEGEKCVSAAQRVLPRMVAVTWPRGTNSVDKCDWSALAGRDVLMWPDADDPGRKALEAVQAELARVGVKRFRYIDVWAGAPSSAGQSGSALPGAAPPDGWDIADAVDGGWSKDQITAWAKARAIQVDLIALPEGLVYGLSAAEGSEMGQDAPPGVSNAGQSGAFGPLPGAGSGESFGAASSGSARSGNVHDFRTGQDVTGTPWYIRCILTEEGAPKKASPHNATICLTHHPEMEGVLGYDTVRQREVIRRAPPWSRAGGGIGLNDHDAVAAANWLEAQGLGVLKDGTVHRLLCYLARQNPFNPLTEWLDGLRWDGKSRVAYLWTRYFGARAGGYEETVSVAFLVSCVARAYQPGCKVDTMPVLEGDQGQGKSSGIAALVGHEWFTDSLQSFTGTDAYMALDGCWVAEVAELSAMSKSEVAEVKRFLSKQFDRYRRPYGRVAAEHPRMTVLIGTVNPMDGYLRDPTGARRFWPVAVGKVDLDAIKRDRDQLWAEAVALFRAGEAWHLTGGAATLAAIEQEARYEEDIWSGEFERFLAVSAGHVAQAGEFMEFLQVPKERWTRDMAARTRALFARAGWRYGPHRDLTGKVRKGWLRPGT